METVRKLYSPLTNPRTGELISHSWVPGSELGWSIVANRPEPPSFAVDAFRYVFLGDPDWDWRTLDLDRDLARADVAIKELQLESRRPDIQPFADSDGKLLLFHGWSDTVNAPGSTIDYYENVRRVLGDSVTANSIRLYMAPGMGHCRGGEGPNSFDPLEIMRLWVEDGQAPGEIIAAQIEDGQVTRTRPLCPFPQVACYRGTGDVSDVANFECRLPSRGDD